MGYTCRLYLNFKKNENSTKQPFNQSGLAHTDFSCEMVEPCSILHPVMSFNFVKGSGANPRNYNYAYMEEWGRLYYISDWTWRGGLWYASMEVDYLGTWKNQMLATRQYVLRQAHVYDPLLQDSFYPAKTNSRIVDKQFEPFPAHHSTGEGTFIIGIIGEPTAERGFTAGVQYYCGTRSEMTPLFEKLFSSADYLNAANITDISTDLLKCLVNPAQYVASIRWFPFRKSQFETLRSASVKLGWWNTGVTLDVPSAEVYLSGQVDRPLNNASEYQLYLHYAPYTEIWVNMPVYGHFQLDTSKFPHDQKIEWDLRVDMASGSGTISFRPENQPEGGGLLMTAQVAQTVALGVSNSDLLAGAQAVASGFSTGTSLVNSVVGMLGAVGDAAKAVSPDASLIGNNGAPSGFDFTSHITGYCKSISGISPAHFGYPYMKYSSLSQLTGYTQLGSPHWDFDAYPEEKAALTRLTEAGFYIE